jgi:hypothetical protein
MPMIRSLYPAHWNSIALAIKNEANWTCQECDRPCRRPGESPSEFEERLTADSPEWGADLYEVVETEEFGEMPLPTKIGRFTLTVAHLDHVPPNCSPGNLRAWCAPCHCRYDLRAMPTKRMLKAERDGQLNLFGSESAGKSQIQQILLEKK